MSYYYYNWIVYFSRVMWFSDFFNIFKYRHCLRKALHTPLISCIHSLVSYEIQLKILKSLFECLITSIDYSGNWLYRWISKQYNTTLFNIYADVFTVSHSPFRPHVVVFWQCKKLVFEFAPVILVNAEQFLEQNDICAILHACEPAVDKEQPSPRKQTSLHSVS